MADNKVPYRESLLQWIWEQLEFNLNGLKTVCNRPVEIVHQGELNTGAGPDFLNAHLYIDGLDWFGSIEIHNRPEEWGQHKHHSDTNYNGVILHVVYSDSPGYSAVTQNGVKPFTLVLKPFLNKSLNRLLEIKQSRTLPCGNNITWIHQEAFERQLNRVHREYFIYKSEELLRIYDPGLLPSEAWLRCFTSKIYDALGIPANRKSMVLLADELFSIHKKSDCSADFIQSASDIAFSCENKSEFNWKLNGMRPSSAPRVRVKQAAALHHAVYAIPFKHFLNRGVDIWEQLIHSVPPDLRPGASRCSIIKNTVFLPAVYLLGELFCSARLKSASYEQWLIAKTDLPEEVEKPFLRAGYTLNDTTRKAGLAHQYKRYCIPKQCHCCEVFKSAIRS
jgi:hypothetical protein